MLYCIGVAILVRTIMLGGALLFVAAMQAFLAQEAPSFSTEDPAFSKHLAVTTALHIIGGGDHRFTN